VNEMTNWETEDEYGDIEEVEAQGFGASEAPAEKSILPNEVMSRISAYAERTGKSVVEATQEFYADIEKHYGCTEPSQEDEELLIDWAEQFFVETRKRSGGASSKLQTFVGCFVGMADKKADRLKNIVAANLKLFKENPNEAISSGRLGAFEKGDNGKWTLVTKEGTKELDTPTSETPQYSIKVGSDLVCLTTYNNDPSPYVKMGRYFYFLGDEEENFVKNGSIRLWRIDMTGKNVYLKVDVGRPCKIQVTPPRDNAGEAFQDVLGTYDDVDITYTDEFVSDNLRPLLHPSRFWTNPEFHDLFVSIDELEEAYEERKLFANIEGERKSYGPLVITKGTINRLNTEPRDSDYDDEGHNYNMTLNSNITGDIDCWIPGAVGKCSEPFRAHWGEDSYLYAEKSTVFVFGRIGMKTKDGLTSPKLTVFGIYADPRRSRERITGGDTGVGQFD